MKKAIIIALIVILAAYGVVATIAATEFRIKVEDLRAEYKDLESEYSKLKVENEKLTEAEEPIVGQWVYENGGNWYLFLSNGDAYRISQNTSGEYITSAPTREKWHKEDGKFYWKTEYSEDADPVHIDGDTLVFGDNVYEWYRVPDDELIPLNEIYYFTFDEKNMEYVPHALDELVGGKK